MATATKPAVDFSFAEETRRVNVGDIVWYAFRPEFVFGTPLEVLPAIVSRVNAPNDPDTTLALVAFGLTIGMKFFYAVPFSAEPKADHWTWPTEEVPAPVFKSTHEANHINTVHRDRKDPRKHH